MAQASGFSSTVSARPRRGRRTERYYKGFLTSVRMPISRLEEARHLPTGNLGGRHPSWLHRARAAVTTSSPGGFGEFMIGVTAAPLLVSVTVPSAQTPSQCPVVPGVIFDFLKAGALPGCKVLGVLLGLK